MLTPDANSHIGPTRADRRRVIVVIVVTLVAGALMLAYFGRVAWLNLWATEGDVPPVSSLSLAAGSELVSEEIVCGSGGCSAIYEVRPPAGQSVAELAEELGTTPQTTVPGTILDPRNIRLSAEPKGSVLMVIADYVSSE
jgi:hypothetical protein